jgi:predicted PurR-regulated permease PerM
MKQYTPTQKGLLTGTLMIIASLFSLYVLENPVESYFQFIVYIIFCAGVLWSLLSYSVLASDKKSFSNYFSTGFKTFVVISLLMAVFTYIYFSFHPGFRDSKIAENSSMLLKQGNHLPKEIEENAAQLKKMFMPMMISAAIFRYMIIGALLTVIAAGFLSNKASLPDKG